MRFSSIVFISIVTASTNGVPLPSDPEVVALMNPKVDPCKDFYKYSCGKWLSTHQFPENQHHLDTSRTLLGIRNDQVIKHIINENKSVILTDLWESCMAFHKLGHQYDSNLDRDYKRVDMARNHIDLMVLAGEYARTGGSTFLQFTIGPDPFDRTYNTILVSPQLTLPSKYYSDQHFSKIEKDYINYIDKLMWYAANTSPTKKRQRDEFVSVGHIVTKIEKQLANMKKQWFSPVTVQYAFDHWHFSFVAYTKGMELFQKNTKINGNLRIHAPIGYVRYVENMIQNLPLEELRIYIAFRMVHSRAQWVGRDFERFHFDFIGVFLNRKKRYKTPDRAKMCRKDLIKYVPALIGKYFYKEAFDEQQEQMAMDMIKLIQQAMEERISRSTWLDEEYNIRQARVKLSQITTLIGQSKVPESYPAATDLSRAAYPSKIYTILSHSFDEDIKKVGQRRNPDEWTMSPADPNAYYIRDRNAIVLPAAVLQPPLFHGSKVHPARNFGAIGSIMGHELTHGFDSKGSLYNGQGYLLPWWSPATTFEYGEIAKCFETQYSNFQAPYSSKASQLQKRALMNGVLTLNENIADNGGVALAWDAYKKYMTTVQPYTGVNAEDGDRMFFISFAQNWCEKFRDDKLEHYLTWDKRSPGQWRVNGVVMNNEKFAETFKCKRNAPMNPIKKCYIW